MNLILRVPEFVVRYLPLSVIISLMCLAYSQGIGKGTYGEYVANSIIAIIVLLIIVRGISVLGTKLSEQHWGE
jgi:hypothetical protein